MPTAPGYSIDFRPAVEALRGVDLSQLFVWHSKNDDPNSIRVRRLGETNGAPFITIPRTMLQEYCDGLRSFAAEVPGLGEFADRIERSGKQLLSLLDAKL